MSERVIPKFELLVESVKWAEDSELWYQYSFISRRGNTSLYADDHELCNTYRCVIGDLVIREKPEWFKINEFGNWTLEVPERNTTQYFSTDPGSWYVAAAQILGIPLTVNRNGILRMSKTDD